MEDEFDCLVVGLFSEGVEELLMYEGFGVVMVDFVYELDVVVCVFGGYFGEFVVECCVYWFFVVKEVFFFDVLFEL